MTDVKSSIIAGVATVFTTLASVKRPIILQWPPGAYDPVTDTTTPGPQSVPILGFIYAEVNRQGTASSGFSETILLQNTDVVAAGITQRLEEAVKAIVDGAIYEVEYVGYDPVAATVKFLARHG
jgi:hypothetical protein